MEVVDAAESLDAVDAVGARDAGHSHGHGDGQGLGHEIQAMAVRFRIAAKRALSAQAGEWVAREAARRVRVVECKARVPESFIVERKQRAEYF